VRNSGPAEACTIDTLSSVRVKKLENSASYRHTRAGAGFSSDDANGSNPLTARSNGLDNVDGGPDAAFYIQIGII
jgi:hypothetical protein